MELSLKLVEIQVLKIDERSKNLLTNHSIPTNNLLKEISPELNSKHYMTFLRHVKGKETAYIT